MQAMKASTLSRLLLGPGLAALTTLPAAAQLTNNTSTVTNSAAPAAAATTTGGTNINYQTNNAYNNEHGSVSYTHLRAHET